MLVGFILILKNEAIGIYDNEEILNNFINGCLQNNFFNKDDIKIKKYNINSINCLNIENTNYQSKIILEKKEIIKEKKIENIKKELNESEEYKELIKSEEYTKLMQMKIDTKHQINELKKQKIKLAEEKESYEYDLKIYKKLKNEKEKIENFEIPEIFSLKFNIYKKLEELNELNFEVFKIEWEKVKPLNNYSLFSTNTYENLFTNSNNKEEINIDIDI
jgi:hypothetical protein